MNILKFSIFEKYIGRQFFSSYLICLLIVSSVFMIFEFLEKINVFIREDASVFQIFTYLIYKLPFVIQVMSPVAVLIGVLLAVGRLSQLSEITAIRSCGASLFQIIHPLFMLGLGIWLVVFLIGETLVPWTSQRLEELYYIDIRKKAETGALSRNNFWIRQGSRFVNIGLYDSRFARLEGVSIFDVNSDFELEKRLDAVRADWVSPKVGWNMKGVTEVRISEEGQTSQRNFDSLPFTVEETPEDLYKLKRRPETMSFLELKNFTNKLESVGVPVSKHLVDLASKISFPLINLIIILVAFPFALTPARSGTMTKSFIAGVSLGFSYYVIHALSSSLGAAELLPISLSAWTANIIFILLGGFLLLGAELK